MFEELRTFLEVAESKSFTKTAKKLNFSQPTVSQHVKKIEIYFNNITLLTRSASTKQIELTEEGLTVYRRGKEILDLLDRTFEELEELQEAGAQTLRVGTSMTIGNCLLPKVLKVFSRQHPEVKLRVTIDNTYEIAELLSREQIDIGLIEGKEIAHNFKRVDFLTDNMILVAAPEIAAQFPEFSASQLGKMLWITREKGSGTEQYLKGFIESNYIKVENKIEYNSNFAIKEVVREGLGVTFISQLVVNDELKSGELRKLPINKEYPRKLSYILPEEKTVTQTVQGFLDALLQVSQAVEFHP